MIRTTHTYAILEVSQSAYEEIRVKLEEAGYGHVFGEEGEIDMHGIALKPEPKPQTPPLLSQPHHYCVALITEDSQYRPYVYHYDGESKEVEDYLGDPLPFPQEAFDVAFEWADSRGLTGCLPSGKAEGHSG